MKWENLLKTKCPNCEGKLHFRPSNRSIKFHQRRGELCDDMYLCRKCNFQISAGKLQGMVGDLERKYGKEDIIWKCLGKK